MELTPIIMERTYDASAKRVWEAITEKSQMQQWYFDVSGFKPEVGFEFQFEGGAEDKIYVHLCKITEVIPGQKLAYTWRYKGFEGNSFLTFELFPEGDKTRIKLTHEGLETFPDDPAFSKENFREGWNQIIGTNLKKFVEKES